MGRPRTKPIRVPALPAVAKVCPPPCGKAFTTRANDRFCHWCRNRLTKAMHETKYLTPID
jgi:hypothetical protein